MRLDFRFQCRRNWSTRTILCVVEMPLNALFECWSWRHWMFVVPFWVHLIDSFRVPPNVDDFIRAWPSLIDWCMLCKNIFMLPAYPPCFTLWRALFLMVRRDYSICLNESANKQALFKEFEFCILENKCKSPLASIILFNGINPLFGNMIWTYWGLEFIFVSQWKSSK